MMLALTTRELINEVILRLSQQHGTEMIDLSALSDLQRLAEQEILNRVELSFPYILEEQ